MKAQLVQALLREDKTVSQLASEHGMHPNQWHTWRTIALEGLPSLFSRTDSTAALQSEHAKQMEKLYAQIGKLTTQLAWRKRRTGLEPGP